MDIFKKHFLVTVLLILCLSQNTHSLQSLYEIMEISPSATQKELSKQFKLLSRVYHPDKSNDEDDDLDQKKEIYEKIVQAYEQLSDPEQRKKYDEFLLSPLKQINNDNFHPYIRDSTDLWLLRLTMDHCPPCNQMKPAWERVAMALEGIIYVGECNISQNWMISRQFYINSFPAMLFFGEDKKSPNDYIKDSRTPEDFIDFALDELRKLAYQRIDPNFKKVGDDVVILDDNNFDKLVMQSDDLWFVDFYAPWCGHCQQMANQWNKLSTLVPKDVKIAKIDGEKNLKIKNRYQLRGYPALLLFPRGNKKNQYLTYPNDFQRDVKSFLNFIEGSNDEDVVILTVANFEKTVMQSNDIWFVDFYASWCSHCQQMATSWNQLATRLKGFPTLLLFEKGKKKYNLNKEYQAHNRDLFSMERWVRQQVGI